MQELKWSHTYSVGVKHINLQHRHLLDLINSLNKFAAEGHPPQDLCPQLTAFVSYCQEHFRDEEELMREAGYPEDKFLEHKARHEEICFEIFALNERLVKGEELAVADLHSFLGKWIMEHILKLDKQFAPYVKAHEDFSPRGK